MANSKKRKGNAESKNPKKVAKTLTPPLDSSDGEPTGLHTVVSQEELEIAVDTLNELAKHPNLIKSKACKDLRTAVYDFRQSCATGLNSSCTTLSGRITAALADGKYADARVLLAEMRIRGEELKLGALCRWVRDLDVVSGVSTSHHDDAVKRTAKERELITVLDAVLRVAGTIDTTTAVSSDPSPIAVQEVWNLRPETLPEQVYASVLDGTLFNSAPPNLRDFLRVIEVTPGRLRKPPNHHDALLYTTAPGAIPMAETPHSMTHRKHPRVPGLSLTTDLLSPNECKAIIAAGESVNFLPDAPLREDGDVSILAHNFYWVVDQPFHDTLWARIAPFVPSSMGGRLVRGLNRRFRVYRYVPGAEYRCHIDGAWPPSGILPDDTYVYDNSPKDKKQSSLFTFLIYLNDEFEGGETTYFLPSAKEGTLNAYPVRPVMGAVAIFPHGDTTAVLHEGTGVRKGAKYVIRTEVEYDVDPTPGV